MSTKDCNFYFFFSYYASQPNTRGHQQLTTHSTLQAVFACLLALAAAAPRPDQDATVVLDERTDNGDGTFTYRLETSNGIAEERTGVVGAEGQSNMQGSYSFTLPDGTIAVVTFIADELGYRPESPLLPTPHPLPAHAQEQIRIAEEQRAQGITFERK
ncbi:Cuticle protein AM1159 [Portunus trituberculatus]|uniref:Cuticle protein AM1159 n=1 Tax=Portunus trituberculatus TaxID=210409 RepID=A0A5B7FZD8_PORTR|nr:Cuticle protein AM1159 [Portunus trituberculatus]